MWRIEEEFQAGDLVYHILYGKEWVGVILEVSPTEKGLTRSRKKALIHMMPGTEHSSHFEKAFSVQAGPYKGWVSCNWLAKFS
jgi:hypothetical protein